MRNIDLSMSNRDWTRTRNHVLSRLKRNFAAGATWVLRSPWLLPTVAPLLTRKYPAVAGQRTNDLLVFLPGIGDVMEDYEVNGFITAVRSHGHPLDMIIVDAHLGYYINRSIIDRLDQDIIDVALSEGYQRVWLVGISMGGLGSIVYASLRPGKIAGLVLLAPFLGSRRLIREIRSSGGPDKWTTDPSDTVHFQRDYQRWIWTWLKGYAEGFAPGRPPLYLGFGEHDIFAPANRLLSQLLPDEHVFAIPGGHDWMTWQKLWREIVVEVPFCTRPLQFQSQDDSRNPSSSSS